MASSKLMSWIAFGSAVLLAVIFITSGKTKIADVQAFIDTINTYQLLPAILIPYLAHYLVWLELSIGMGVLIPFTRRATAFVLLVLLLVFTGAIASLVVRGIDTDCGCLDAITLGDSLWLALGRNFVLILMAGVVLKIKP